MRTVVMEHIEGKIAESACLKDTREKFEKVIQKARRRLKHLQTSAGTRCNAFRVNAFLIDFDWAGRLNEAHPRNLEVSSDRWRRNFLRRGLSSCIMAGSRLTSSFLTIPSQTIGTDGILRPSRGRSIMKKNPTSVEFPEPAIRVMRAEREWYFLRAYFERGFGWHGKGWL